MSTNWDTRQRQKGIRHYSFMPEVSSCNLKMFSQAAAGSGFFNISPGPDGILRRVPTDHGTQRQMLSKPRVGNTDAGSGQKRCPSEDRQSGVESLILNKTAIPLTSKGNMLIRFRGKGKTFDYISAADILSDRIPREKIRGK